MHRELKENPEFFKAFPHLQEAIYKKENPWMLDESMEYTDNPRSVEYSEKEDLQTNASKQDGYFASLLHQHTRY